MTRPLNDADIERIAHDSAVVRTARQAFVALDAAAGSSLLSRALSRLFTLRAGGLTILVAAVTHGAIVSFVPAASAPLGRYLVAVVGIVAGALMLLLDRTKS